MTKKIEQNCPVCHMVGINAIYALGIKTIITDFINCSSITKSHRIPYRKDLASYDIIILNLGKDTESILKSKKNIAAIRKYSSRTRIVIFVLEHTTEIENEFCSLDFDGFFMAQDSTNEVIKVIASNIRSSWIVSNSTLNSFLKGNKEVV